MAVKLESKDGVKKASLQLLIVGSSVASYKHPSKKISLEEDTQVLLERSVDVHVKIYSPPFLIIAAISIT